MDWEPIETAPKTHTIRLKSSAGEDVGRWEEDRYCMLGAPMGSYGPGWVDEYNRLPMAHEFEPTHWRPL